MACLLTLIVLGCSEVPSQGALSPGAQPTNLSWVRIIDGGFCNANYKSFVESKMDWLRASGLLNWQSKCICPPESLDHVKRRMREPPEMYWKHIELGLAIPFSLPLISGEVKSVLISGFRMRQAAGTVVYFGTLDRHGSLKYRAFILHGSDYFNLNYQPVWFRPSTWNAVTSDRNCKPLPDITK